MRAGAILRADKRLQQHILLTFIKLAPADSESRAAAHAARSHDDEQLLPLLRRGCRLLMRVECVNGVAERLRADVPIETEQRPQRRHGELHHDARAAQELFFAHAIVHAEAVAQLALRKLGALAMLQLATRHAGPQSAARSWGQRTQPGCAHGRWEARRARTRLHSS